MHLRHLCGAILTLFLAANVFAASGSRVVTAPQERTSTLSQSDTAEFHLASYSAPKQTMASYEKPQLKADAINEMPAASAADMKDPLKYSVWVLIGLGPIMWIWLAFFPRIRRK